MLFFLIYIYSCMHFLAKIEHYLGLVKHQENKLIYEMILPNYKYIYIVSILQLTSKPLKIVCEFDQHAQGNLQVYLILIRKKYCFNNFIYYILNVKTFTGITNCGHLNIEAQIKIPEEKENATELRN